jgi:DNA-binding NtrC family response regulator
MMTAPPRKPASVLIVDDEAGLRRVLERFLERQGYRVLSA